jgi:hypothetical protein
MKRFLAVVLVGLVLLATGQSIANRELPDYRYFRALSIDLVGRPPTRLELADFERTDFDLDVWIESHLVGSSYAERLRRIYMDLLRLELPVTVQFRPGPVMLHWATILDPAGRRVVVYFRPAQRRKKPELDGQICFSEAEIGVKVTEGAQVGTLKPVSQALLDARTVVVKPWWLYADYRSPNPQDRASPEWRRRFGFDLELAVFVQPDADKTPMTGVRVCREEAQTAETGRVYASGRIVTKSDSLLPGRQSRLPADSPFATANAGRPVSCLSNNGFQSSVECGCGVGLERCLPNAPGGFMTPTDAPLGIDQPFSKTARPSHLWLLSWIGEEAVHFLDNVFADDHDVRELLTGRGSAVNGPLAQFYRFFANATCCGPGADFGYVTSEPLFDPAAVPNLAPHDALTWQPVADRGPHAAGLMTMPIFLLKYGTRRQRAHAIYSAFLCKDFVSNNAKLEPSTEPDLTKRPGCANCHQRLEPMAAYFARVQESDWTYLPAAQFPISLPRCTGDPTKKMRGGCKLYYDPAFTDASHTTLRGAYAAPDHADAGPAGFAAEVTSAPEFAPCVVRNVAQSFLGRVLTPEDDPWKAALAKTFVDGGYRMRPLVRAIVTSERYRDANDQLPVPR